MYTFDFWMTSVLFGAGLAIDIAIVTIASFRDRGMNFINWTLPLVITHVWFPSVGIFLFWYLGDEQTIKIILGILGFSFIFVFLFLEFKELIATKRSAVFYEIKPNLERNAMILAVSWDALLSGPSYSTQAIAKGWSNLEISSSVVVFGIIILIASTLALRIARKLNELEFVNLDKFTNFTFLAELAKFTVIGSFGVFSLQQAFGEGSLYLSLVITAILFFALFLIFRETIRGEIKIRLIQESLGELSGSGR